MKETKIADLKALDAYARTLAAVLEGGTVIGLVGDLGAGKTALTQRIAAALGVQQEVKSPTFILMQVFETDSTARARGVERLCHVDAYRLEDYAELRTIGFEEYAGDSRTVTVVEWADRVPDVARLPGYRELTFRFGKDGERIISQK